MTNAAVRAPSEAAMLEDESANAVQELPTSIMRSLGDRSYERRKAAALEVEQLVKELNQRSPGNNDAALRRLIGILTTDFVQSTQANYRKGGLIALAATAIGLMKDTTRHLEEILPPVLLLLHDQESRVRYYACEALYNITKVTRGNVLRFFSRIYDGLCTLHADPDPDVRSGAVLLDRLVKDVVTESDAFDIDAFMPLLQERIRIRDAAVRDLNVGWVQVLDSVPDIDLLRYLPRFLVGLFEMLADASPNIVRAADAVLHEFLREIEDAYPMKLDDIIPILVELLTDDASEAICVLAALGWLHGLIELAKADLLPLFPSIIDSVLSCMSNTDEEIRRKAEVVNADMMECVQQTDDGFGAEDLLQHLARQLDSQSVETKLAVLSWMSMLLQRKPNTLFNSLEELFPALLSTLTVLSDAVVVLDLNVLSSISRNASYFDAVLTHLIDKFDSDPELLESRGALIVRQFSSQLGWETVYRAFARLLHDDRRYKSASRLVQTLNLLLMTSSDLYPLRDMLQTYASSDEGRELFCTLFRSWCHNPVASLSLCMLAQCYELGAALVLHFTEIPVSISSLLQIDQLVQLIESPIFLRLRLQLLDPRSHPFLLKILYGLLMLLPQGTSFKALSTRLQSVSTLGMFDFMPSRNGTIGDSTEDLGARRTIDIGSLHARFVETQAKHAEHQRYEASKRLLKTSPTMNVDSMVVKTQPRNSDS